MYYKKSKLVRFDSGIGPLVELFVPHTVYPPREDTTMMVKAIDMIQGGAGEAVEIGVGSGALSIAMAQRGWKVKGFDLNPLSVAASRGNVNKMKLSDMISIEEGGPGFEGWKIPKCDLLIWNLPYLNPVKENEQSLEPLEELGLSDLDAEGGWSNEIRKYIEDYNEGNKPLTLILFRTKPRSPSNPEDWKNTGWAGRTIVKEIIGDDTLEVVAFWKPSNENPALLLESVNSTMDYAKSLNLEGWHRVRVTDQTSGRGRNYSEWKSVPGDLIATWSIDNEILEITTPGALQLCVGACIAKTMKADLKWPNDIYVNGKKLGGVLIETSSDQEKIRIGVGINKIAPYVKGRDTAGWQDLEPETEVQELFVRIDSELSSWIEKHQKLPFPLTNEIQRFSWEIMSKSLSRGVISEEGAAFRICGINTEGELIGVNEEKKFSIDYVRNLIISF